jgi:hypothetical protein
MRLQPPDECSVLLMPISHPKQDMKNAHKVYWLAHAPSANYGTEVCISPLVCESELFKGEPRQAHHLLSLLKLSSILSLTRAPQNARLLGI